ncbi:hypothetical protein BU26DRAFT_519004 [Trematosphaeria pertusa]|uniref:Mid2 domain-containing protein n=1 Tax=Trematosphaeria pertusa TaxID=390896 RepID=A0A6A6IDZ5_9PLEO|nr:uncharacterized protein BU26DRAFT_519004 [Trematosphaeria pertusa]KAF2248795.1 hypothetical protein BU26DRAFT_519004 [Trematosphaeria pertusa]
MRCQHSTLLILPFSFSLLTLTRATTCYAPNGSIETNTEYQPCSNDTSDPLSTICCAWNRANGPDICVPNGLCQRGPKEGETEQDAEYTKPQCTEQNWDDPGCLNVCNGKNLEWLTPCDRSNSNESRRWCCGLSDECCNEDLHLQIETLAARFGDPTDIPSLASTATTLPLSTISVSGSATTTATSDTTPTTLTDSPQSQSNNGLSSGAKAGIGIGATLGGLLLIGLGIWLGKYLHARKGGENEKAELYGGYERGQDGSFYGAPREGGLSVYKARDEVEDQRANVELPDHRDRDPTELP